MSSIAQQMLLSAPDDRSRAYRQVLLHGFAHCLKAAAAMRMRRMEKVLQANSALQDHHLQALEEPKLQKSSLGNRGADEEVYSLQKTKRMTKITMTLLMMEMMILIQVSTR